MAWAVLVLVDMGLSVTSENVDDAWVLILAAVEVRVSTDVIDGRETGLAVGVVVLKVVILTLVGVSWLLVVGEKLEDFTYVVVKNGLGVEEVWVVVGSETMNSVF